ncbi:MAG: hypothetical protein Q8O67_07700 [Deltaproteobacteria bacterium]|nr:hypothetical protein [Deltaproteobacteria bacterium]
MLLWLHDVDAAKVKPKVQWQVDDDSAPIEITLRKKTTEPEQQQQPTTTTTAPAPRLPAPAPAPVPADDVVASADPDPDPRPPAASNDPPPSYAPRNVGTGRLIDDVVVGLDKRGPRPSTRALGEALDFQPDSEQDKALSGGKLAVARATRRLRGDLSFADVSMGLGDDWFRGVKDATQRAFRPSPGDLDNPDDVSRASILANYLRDPAGWDEEARAALENQLQAMRVASRDPIDRLPLQNSANLGQAADTMLRRSTVDDLLRRKEAGLAVRFAFEVDVHHAADGAVTAIDVLRTEFERSLVEKVRMAVERAVQEAPAVPERVAHGLPFRSRWLMVATWYLDPPRPMFATSNSVMTRDGEGGRMAPPLGIGGNFGPGENDTSSFDVKLKTSAELLDVTPMR